jgi:hypothetical protein
MVIFSGEALQAAIEKQGLKMFLDKFFDRQNGF